MLQVAVRVLRCRTAASGLRRVTARVGRPAWLALPSWRRPRSEKEPIRSFSVPSGLSSARPSLTIALATLALLGCSTAVVGTLLTTGWMDTRPALPHLRPAPVFEVRQPAAAETDDPSLASAERPARRGSAVRL